MLPSGAALIGAGSGAGLGSATGADCELYADGSWTLTGQLPYQVDYAAICLLSSGDVLSAGGAGANWIAAATRYSSASGTWSPAFAMADSHYQGALAALAGDRAVILDGWDEIPGGDGSETFASDGGSEIYQGILINTAPSFTAGPDQEVLENSGQHTIPGWATAISPGLPAESAQTISFLAATTNPGLFSIPPMVDGAGTLTYALAADAFGAATVTIQAHDDGGTADGGRDTSPAQTVTITAAFVNVPPTFTIGASQTVLGTAGAQSIPGFLTAVSPGPADEASFSVQITVAATASQLFASQPLIDAQGTLTYAPAAGQGGVATVAVTATNSGGTANGGVAATTQTFTITVVPVVPPPQAGNAAATTLENQPYAGSLALLWSDPGVAAPTITYAVVGSPLGGTLSAFDPATGAYIFLPATDAVAPASFSYQVADQYNASAPATVSITILAVNQPPQWTPGQDVTVAEGSPPYTGVGWATGISPGPANQSGEAVAFALQPSLPALFSVPPALAPDGTLTFTPAPGRFGQSLVTAVLGNSGGTANGGSDAAPPVTFAITITQVLRAPTAQTLTLHTVLGVAVSGSITLSDPDHQLPPDPPAYALTGISQLGALTVSASGLVTFIPGQAGSQQIPFTVTVAGAAYPGVIMLFDNALVAGRPLVASIPGREQGASGSPWTYDLTVDPLSIAAGDALTVGVQSDDAALAAAAITPTSGNQFHIAVPALAAGGGPLQALTLIVTDLTTDLSDIEVIFVVVAPPGGPT